MNGQREHKADNVGPNELSAPTLPSSPARLIVADDHDLVRESMRAMLENEPDLQIIAQARDGSQVIELCRVHFPDLVLMDAKMPKANGFEATQSIKREFPSTKVLICSPYEYSSFVSEAKRAGADGYILRLSSIEEILQAIRGLLRD